MNGGKNKEIDIVAIVQNNPLARLSDFDYQSKIVNKIKTNFNSEEESLFIANFYAYLNSEEHDFIINFDKLWKWLGYTRIDHCKTVLTKHFKENVDYRIVKTAPENSGAVSESKKNGGQNKDNIFLTVDCFKLLCNIADTEKGKEVRKYYVTLEKILIEVVDEEHKFLRQQLQLKDKEITIIKENTKIKNEKELLLKHHKRRGLYLIIIIIVENGITYYIVKFGITDDITDRLTTHRREISKDIILVYFLETVYNKDIENKIKELCEDKNDILFKKRMSRKFNDKNQTELIRLDENFTIESLWNKVLDIYKNLDKDEIYLEMENEIMIKNLELTNKDLIIANKDFEITKLKNGTNGEIEHMNV